MVVGPFGRDFYDAKFIITTSTDARTAHLDFVELRAARCAGVDVTSLTHVKEVTKKTCQDVPSWNSLGARANDASLSLCSCLREVLQIQILRSHFDTKCEQVGRGKCKMQNWTEQF
jgi:hypothetical protein